MKAKAKSEESGTFGCHGGLADSHRGKGPPEAGD